MAFGNFAVEVGKALPLGTQVTKRGVNFAVFSRHAKTITLILYQTARPDSPFEEIRLEQRKYRTGDIWHCHIPGLKAGALYLYRAEGPYIPEKGFRFNSNKTLIDPYTKALTDLSRWDLKKSLGYDGTSKNSTDLSYSHRDDSADKPRCIVIDDEFDWQGDAPINYPLRFSVLYETHVRGLTKHPDSGVDHPGTYRGVIEKIPYFKDLGITSLEFLPVQEFNENELVTRHPQTGEILKNYWGYSTVAFFAPKGSYSSDQSPGGQVREFKEMVRELHRAGLEVILDIVFNHTAEGNEMGPTFSFRGLDNSIYYILNEDKRYYHNFSGCGNTVNCNHPVLRTFILDCLRYWVVEMHVDGFRFDLGSILGRDRNGNLMESPPMLERIAEDSVLSSTKIIAEAWDAGGAYQVGWFPGGRWAEWNDRYRDEIRRYWRGDPKETRHLATRLSGSSDLYLRDGRKPFHSINFITSHDGFTLMDLVSYNGKHNEENGEDNRDGGDNNNSYNYGYEGVLSDQSASPTAINDPLLAAIRLRQLKNFFTTLLVSLGTPMLLGGDEMGRTQYGNNNAYCQDNAISWYDWSLVDKNPELLRFVKEMIKFRLRHPGFMRPEFYTGREGSYNAKPDISWYDEKGLSPNWENAGYTLALQVNGRRAEVARDKDDYDFYLMFNAGLDPVTFTVSQTAEGQVSGKKSWFRAIDTARGSPDDILPAGEEELVSSNKYKVQARSIVVLIAKNQ